MKVYFITNLDDAQKVEWPDMDFIPSVGDIIQSVDPIGFRKTSKNTPVHMELGVVKRKFKSEPKKYGDSKGEIYCECELGLTNTPYKTVYDFEKWVDLVKNGL